MPAEMPAGMPAGMAFDATRGCRVDEAIPACLQWQCGARLVELLLPQQKRTLQPSVVGWCVGVEVDRHGWLDGRTFAPRRSRLGAMRGRS